MTKNSNMQFAMNRAHCFTRESACFDQGTSPFAKPIGKLPSPEKANPIFPQQIRRNQLKIADAKQRHDEILKKSYR